MSNFLRRLTGDMKGASLLEYSVLVGIVLVLSLAAVNGVGNWLNQQWVALNTNLTAN
jgi:pilus assembly protein Flp/PilA